MDADAVAAAADEAEHNAKMRLAIESLDRLFNVDSVASDFGIMLMVFPTDKDGMCAFVTNGITPDDMIDMMRMQVAEYDKRVKAN